jgi:hypothetical protein
MATKKAQSKAPASAVFWKWLYVVAILAASILAAAEIQNLWLSVAFALIGLLVGLFYFDSSDLMNFGLRYLIVTAAAAGLDVVPVAGPYLTAFFTAFAAFLAPVILGMVIMFFWKKYFS